MPLFLNLLAYSFAAWRGYLPESRDNFCQVFSRCDIVYIVLATAAILLGLLVLFYNFFDIVILLLSHEHWVPDSLGRGSGSARSVVIP